MTRVRCLVCAALLLLQTGNLAAQDPLTKLEEMLELPMSPAKVALFTLHPDSVEAKATWEKGLKHPSPEVRAAAARAIYAKGGVEFLPDVKQALAAESDAIVAGKLIDAFTILDTSADIGPLIEVSDRLRLAKTISVALARARGEGSVELLPQLRATGLADESLADFLRNAVRGRMSLIERTASAALADGDRALWKASLELASDKVSPLAPWILEAGMNQTGLAARADTAWYLFNKGLRIPAPKDQASNSSPGHEDYLPHQVELDFVRELARRRKGEPPIESSDWIGARNASVPTRFHRNAQAAKNLLTDKELRALSTQLTGNPVVLKKHPGSSAAPKLATLPNALVTSSFTPGLVDSLMALTRCKANKNNVATATLTFALDGRLRSAAMHPSNELPKRCRAAAKALTYMADAHDVASWPAVQFSRDLHILFTPEYLSCTAAKPRSSRQPAQANSVRGIGSVDTPPKLKKKTDPNYLRSPDGEDVYGATVLRVLITDRGCVGRLNVIKSLRPHLDREALVAVSKWTFEPATLAGRPVAVLAEVEVVFAP